MPAISLPTFAPGQPAARVDASLRQALGACDRARECALLWFVEVQRRRLYRSLGHASLQLYATQALGFTDNRYWQFKRLADDLDRLPSLREAVEAGDIGWTKAQQVARVATAETQAAWIEKAATTGRRELELQVRHARKRTAVAPAAQLALDGPLARSQTRQAPSACARTAFNSRGSRRWSRKRTSSAWPPPALIVWSSCWRRWNRWCRPLQTITSTRQALSPRSSSTSAPNVNARRSRPAAARCDLRRRKSRRSRATRGCDGREGRIAPPFLRQQGPPCWLATGIVAPHPDVDRPISSKSTM